MTTKSETINAHWENFNKYVGIQGIMALGLVGGFIYASLSQITLPDLFSQIMTLVIGFYFAKNGVGIVAAIQAGRTVKG